MAFYADDEEEQQDPNSTAGGVQTSGQTGTINGAGSAPGAQSAAAPAQAAASKAPDRGSNFVGIQKYLDANKKQAGKLGDQTAGVINQSADQARQGLGALNSAADQQIKGVAALDSGIADKIQNGAEQLSAEERNLAKQTANAQYTGPKAATDFGDVYTGAQKATKTATDNINNAGTEQGRMGLISQVNSKPRTSGMNIFDNALLQAGGGREKLSQASAANKDVVGGLDAATTNIQNKIGRVDDPNTPDVNEAAGAMGQTATSQADAYKKIQDAMSAWKSGFAPKVGQAQQDLVAAGNRVTQDLGDDQFNLDQEAMDALGLNQGEQLFDTDLKNYLGPIDPSGINAGNVASAEDYARYGALADLAGESDLMLNPANASQAGTAGGLKGDKDKLRTDLAAKKQAYNDQYSSGSGMFGSLGSIRSDWSPTGQTINMNDISPEYFENTLLPHLQLMGGTPAQAATAMEQKLKEWKASMHADKYLNMPGGPKGTLPPNLKGVQMKGGS